MILLTVSSCIRRNRAERHLDARFCQVVARLVTLRQTLFVRIFANFSKAKTMNELVTERELAQARNDPAFRQQFLARNLGRLLKALKAMRRAKSQDSKTE